MNNRSSLPVVPTTICTFIFVTCCLFAISKSVLAGDSRELQSSVANLKLGLGEYTLATQLSADQVEFASKNRVEKAYQGTYKFKDRDIYVVADKSNNMILALYKRQAKAVNDQMKTMVSELMATFGEPTTMAHEKMIYWVYNRQGKVDDEVYNKARKAGTTSDLGIIASVKFSSSIDIKPDTQIKSGEEKEGKEKSTSTIYFILTSDPLIKGFMGTAPLN